MNPLSNLFSAGVSAATGNPIGAALGIGGFALSVLGNKQKADYSEQIAGVSKKMTGVEMDQDKVRQQAMELSARRQQIEVLRNAQRARSLALNNATSQGAQQGSGLQGGYGQIAGATAWNSLGINQSLLAGNQMFGLNAKLSGLKMQMADWQSKQAQAQGTAALGGSLMQASGPIGNLTKGLFQSGNISSPGGAQLDTWGGFNDRMGTGGTF